jgi:iron complex outermembrane recepter protein
MIMMRKIAFTIACCFFNLAQASITLPTIDVKTYQPVGFIKHPQSVAPLLRIGKRAIDHSGAQLTQDVLQQAGAIVRNMNGDGTNPVISLSGFGDNTEQNVLLLINGEPMSHPDLAAVNFNAIPVTLLQSIDVQTGSYGVRYGDGAVGGVINFNTFPSNQNTQTISTTLGSYDTQGIFALLNHVDKNNWRYRLQGGYRTSDHYRDHNRERLGQFSASLLKAFESGQFAMQYDTQSRHNQYPGALTRAQMRQNRRQVENPLSKDYFAQSLQNLQARDIHVFDDATRLQLASRLSQMTGHGILTNPFSTNRHAIDIDPTVSIDQTLLGKQAAILIGSDFRYGRYRFNNLNYDSLAKQTILAAFTSINFHLSKTWEVIAGVRGAKAFDTQKITLSGVQNRVSKSYQLATTKLGLRWQINKTLQAFIRRAGNYRFPSTDENINTVTNKPLKPQTGYDNSLGINWQTPKQSGLFKVYALSLKNEIMSIPIPNSQTTFAQNQNYKPTERLGLDLGNTWNITSRFSTQLFYHYVDAHFSSGPDKGNRIPFVANHQAALTLFFKLNTHWNSELGSTYTGKRSYANDPEERSPLLGGYTLIHFNLQYHWKRLTLNFRINNILNKHFSAYAFDVYQGQSASSYYYPAPGINAMLDLSLRLS